MNSAFSSPHKNYLLLLILLACLLISHGMGMETGIDLDKLVDAGEYICEELGRPTQSKVSKAILAKRQTLN